MTRVVVLIAGLGFLGFGLAGLIDPVGLLGSMGLTVDASGALRTELRAFYGGLEIGLGALLLGLLLAGRPRDALGLSLVTYGALAGGRIVGIFADGGAAPITLLALLIEVGVAGAAGWRFQSERRSA